MPETQVDCPPRLISEAMGSTVISVTSVNRNPVLVTMISLQKI